MNHPSIVLTVVVTLVVHSFGHPHNNKEHEHGGSQQQPVEVVFVYEQSNSGSGGLKSHGDIGHGGGGGFQQSQYYDSRNELKVPTGFSSKQVEMNSGSQLSSGASLGYQQGGNHGIGSNGGYNGDGYASGSSSIRDNGNKLQVASEYSNKHVIVNSGSQPVIGTSSLGYQQGGSYEIGSSGGNHGSGNDNIQGSGSKLEMAPGFLNKYVDMNSGSQSIAGSFSGYPQGASYGTYSNSGYNGDGYAIGSSSIQGSGNKLQMIPGYSNKHVVVNSGSQPVGGTSLLGHQQGGSYEIGSSGGNYGSGNNIQGSGSELQVPAVFLNKLVGMNSGNQSVSSAWSFSYQQGGSYKTGSNGDNYSNGSGIHGSGSELEVAPGFSNKHVSMNSGGQSIGGSQLGYPQGGNYGSGLNSGNHGGGFVSGSDSIQGNGSELQVPSGFFNKHVGMNSGGQSIGGSPSGYPHGGSYGTGSSVGHQGVGFVSGSDSIQGNGSELQVASGFLNKHVGSNFGSQLVGGVSSLGSQQGGSYGTGSSNDHHGSANGSIQGYHSEYQVVSGFYNKHVEVSPGSQSIGGASLGYQQVGSSGIESSGGHQSGGSVGAEYGSQPDGQKKTVINESSGFTAVHTKEIKF